MSEKELRYIPTRKEFIEQRLSDIAWEIARLADARMDIPAELMSELDEWWKELY